MLGPGRVGRRAPKPPTEPFLDGDQRFVLTGQAQESCPYPAGLAKTRVQPPSPTGPRGGQLVGGLQRPRPGGVAERQYGDRRPLAHDSGPCRSRTARPAAGSVRPCPRPADSGNAEGSVVDGDGGGDRLGQPRPSSDGPITTIAGQRAQENRCRRDPRVRRAVSADQPLPGRWRSGPAGFWIATSWTTWS